MEIKLVLASVQNRVWHILPIIQQLDGHIFKIGFNVVFNFLLYSHLLKIDHPYREYMITFGYLEQSACLSNSSGELTVS